MDSAKQEYVRCYLCIVSDKATQYKPVKLYNRLTLSLIALIMIVELIFETCIFYKQLLDLF